MLHILGITYVSDLACGQMLSVKARMNEGILRDIGIGDRQEISGTIWGPSVP
jgi:hypothetical protein